MMLRGEVCLPWKEHRWSWLRARPCRGHAGTGEMEDQGEFQGQQAG